jgi:hypothetical protein
MFFRSVYRADTRSDKALFCEVYTALNTFHGTTVFSAKNTTANALRDKTVFRGAHRADRL